MSEITVTPGPPYGVIFDIDGVLVDSWEPHLKSWQRLAEELEVEFGEAAFAETFGRTSRDILRSHFGEDLSDADVEAHDRRKEEMYREIVRENFPAMPGAAELIDRLAAAGFRLAAGSSGPPENVELALQQLSRAASFRAVVTGRDVTHGKPHPEVFLTAAEKLELEPGNCVVIEDAPAGIEAAHRAGMPAVALASRGRAKAALSEAERVVERLEEISPAALVGMIEHFGR